MINFILGFVIGGGVVYFFLEVFLKNGDKGGRGLIDGKESEKAKNIKKLKDFVVSSDGNITNDQVQELLNISDATAERYLDEMEKAGLVKQVGKEGKYTYYKKA